MQDYYFKAVCNLRTSTFIFAVHMSSCESDLERVIRYVKIGLSVHYGFKDVDSFALCDYSTYCDCSCRIDLA